MIYPQSIHLIPNSQSFPSSFFFPQNPQSYSSFTFFFCPLLLSLALEQLWFWVDHSQPHHNQKMPHLRLEITTPRKTNLNTPTNISMENSLFLNSKVLSGVVTGRLLAYVWVEAVSDGYVMRSDLVSDMGVALESS